MDSNFTPHKVIVAQALRLPHQWTKGFMSEQPDRFVAYLDTKSDVVNEYVCTECFLNEQFGTTNPEDLCSMFFEDRMHVHHYVNVINYLTDFKAVAFFDESDHGGFAVVVNHPYNKGDGLDEFERKAVESASETITIKVANDNNVPLA